MSAKKQKRLEQNQQNDSWQDTRRGGQMEQTRQNTEDR